MVIRESLETPVAAHCDVLVAGGGVAGISAALAAARCGAEVILLERSYMLGGLATAGLITIYLPLCDGHGTQASYGIAEELLHLSMSLGAEADYPDAWLPGGDVEKRKTQRFQVQYNAQNFALLAEKLLLENGVRILYGAQVCAMHVCSGRAEAAVIEGKSGRQAVCARSFVDATGDADLFCLAGASTRVFKQGNILAAWYYRVAGGKYSLKTMGVADVPDERRAELGTPELLMPRRFEGLTTEELTEMTLLAHERILQDVQKHQQDDPSYMPATLATTPQVRMTRCIEGAYTMDDMQYGVSFPDSIGKIADWRRRGYVYDVPFRALYGMQVRNLIAAGRCISATDAMWDISRVIPACAVTGEAAGTAAALTGDFHTLNIPELQRKLAQMSARPDIEEVSAC